MNIFNRRELIVTMSIEKFSQITNALNSKNITYTYKTVNTSGVPSGTIQSIGLNSNYMLEYYIYVHKKDYGRACVAARELKLI